MHVEVTGSGGSGKIEVWVTDPLPDVPRWVRLEPDAHRPILTNPPSHHLEQASAEVGPAHDLVEAARLFIGGEINRAAAGDRIIDALTLWSRLRAAYS